MQIHYCSSTLEFTSLHCPKSPSKRIQHSDIVGFVFVKTCFLEKKNQLSVDLEGPK